MSDKPENFIKPDLYWFVNREKLSLKIASHLLTKPVIPILLENEKMSIAPKKQWKRDKKENLNDLKEAVANGGIVYISAEDGSKLITRSELIKWKIQRGDWKESLTITNSLKPFPEYDPEIHNNDKPPSLDHFDDQFRIKEEALTLQHLSQSRLRYIPDEWREQVNELLRPRVDDGSTKENPDDYKSDKHSLNLKDFLQACAVSGDCLEEAKRKAQAFEYKGPNGKPLVKGKIREVANTHGIYPHPQKRGRKSNTGQKSPAKSGTKSKNSKAG